MSRTSRTSTAERTPGADNRWASKVNRADWAALTKQLDEHGCALLPQLLTKQECARIAGLYDRTELFRSTVNMDRLRYGSGEYRYFHAPFPEPVQAMRDALYPRLLPVARDWYAKLGRDAEWPDTLDEWLQICHDAGQRRPTPTLLSYRENGWNALHRDLYGEKVFPLQVVLNLSEPGVDHTGGEFLLVEQRPRAQSRGTATLVPQGHGLVFTTRDRPVASKRGWTASPVRHGVSTVHSGRRFTLGLVFHDAA